MPRPLSAVTLSHSTFAAFDECRRRFLFRVGSDFLAPELRWRVKREARLSPLAAFPGRVVDETLTQALRHYAERGRWPDDLQHLGRKIAGVQWRGSQAWVGALQRGGEGAGQPLDVHYFGEAVPPAEIARIKARIALSLENFTTAGLRGFLERVGPAYWRFPRPPGGPLPRFDLDGVPVWAVFDFAVQLPEVTYLFDWKTGSPSQGSALRAAEQLAWYALYAHREWGTPAAALRLVPVWLNPVFVSHELEVDVEELEALTVRIRERYGLVLELLRLLPGSEVPLELWPITENVSTCRYCPFRRSCEGGTRLAEAPPAESYEDPFDLETS